jgi:hypothetical protein
MEFRQLGASGLRVPALSFGTATFGGGSDFYRAWEDHVHRLLELFGWHLMKSPSISERNGCRYVR